MIFTAASALINRDIHRILRQKMRLAGTLVRPLLWLLVIGTGFSGIIPSIDNYAYQTYLMPGLIGMVLLFGGVLCALTTALEKDAGTIRLLLVAPFSRIWIILFRATSAAIVALIYTALFILVVYPFHFIPSDINYPLFVISIVLCAHLWGSFGMFLVVLSKSMENFSLIINFVVFPLYFLSGALYPLQHLPEYMKFVTQLNPFCYCVDLIQHSMKMTAVTHYTLAFDCAVITISTVLLLALTSIIFMKKSFEDL